MAFATLCLALFNILRDAGLTQTSIVLNQHEHIIKASVECVKGLRLLKLYVSMEL